MKNTPLNSISWLCFIVVLGILFIIPNLPKSNVDYNPGNIIEINVIEYKIPNSYRYYSDDPPSVRLASLNQMMDPQDPKVFDTEENSKMISFLGEVASKDEDDEVKKLAGKMFYSLCERGDFNDVKPSQ